MKNLIRGSLEDEEAGTALLTRVKTKAKKPSLYKVVLLNDDYTPMDFVIYILERFFRKTAEEAVRLMLDVHNKGSAVCGVYTYEVAEMKVSLVAGCACEHGHPLQCVMEKE